MPLTPWTVRIKKEASRQLVFEVWDGAGFHVARSATYPSICKLEAGLAMLMVAAQQSDRAVVERDDIRTAIQPVGRRARVCLDGSLSDGRIQEMLASLSEAVVRDDRSPSEKRFDLSGRLCDLHD